MAEDKLGDVKIEFIGPRPFPLNAPALTVLDLCGAIASLSNALERLVAAAPPPGRDEIERMVDEARKMAGLALKRTMGVNDE